MLASVLPTTAGGDADFCRLRGTKSGYRSNPLVPHSKGSVGRLASSSPTSWTYPARYPQARHDNNIKGKIPSSRVNKDELWQRGRPPARRTPSIVPAIAQGEMRFEAFPLATTFGGNQARARLETKAEARPSHLRPAARRHSPPLRLAAARFAQA
jgi:hypothetical protein